MLPVAILAGGLATRMRPLTQTIPKALLDIAGEPFLARQLAYLKAQGLTRAVVCTGYLGGQIEAVIGNGSAFGLEVLYSPDGSKLLGTGGALRKALPLLGEAFFVLYGDSFLPVDFSPIEARFHAAGKLALMTVLKNDNRWDKSNVLVKDGRLKEYNKKAPRPEMNFIDYGLGIVRAAVLSAHVEGEAFDLSEVYHALSLKGELEGYEVTKRFYEIGSFQGLEETTQYFLNNPPPSRHYE